MDDLTSSHKSELSRKVLYNLITILRIFTPTHIGQKKGFFRPKSPL
jgi:hypothetical protein